MVSKKETPVTEAKLEKVMEKVVVKMGKVVQRSILEYHEQVLSPVLDQIIGDVSELKGDMAELKSDVAGLKVSMGQLEHKMDIVAEVGTETRTNHERRIRVLESRTGVKPVARLMV